jgi:ferric-dicitrate binding protein FerR (iron transport regulator)
MNLDRFDEFLDAYLLGELSEEQSAQLQEALETDSAARRRFVQSILIESHLHRLARSEAASATPCPQRLPEADARRRMTPGTIVRSRRLALAVVVLVAIGAIAVFQFARHDSGTFARVASGNVLVDGQCRNRIPDGSTLRVTGPAPAVIHLSDGSLATLDPATQLTLRGRVDSIRQVLQLTAGGGRFQVPQGGGQFRIDTPAGSVTVLGTEFTAVLRSPRTLFLSVAAGTVRFDCEGSAFTVNTGQSHTFGPEPDTTGKSQIIDGWIHAVDLKAGSFVLGGKNESQTTIRVGVKTGEREAVILLDGKRTNPATAIKPGVKASVTCVKVGDDLWASRLEVTSAAK